jgi:hypothetical protein
MKARIPSLTTLIERAGAFAPARPRPGFWSVLVGTLRLRSDPQTEWTPTYPGAGASYEARRFLWLGPRPCLDRVHACFQERATENVVLDRRTWGVVRSKTGQRRLFRQRYDGFTPVGSCRAAYTAWSGSEEPYSGRSPAQRLQKWQDRRMIPVHMGKTVRYWLGSMTSSNSLVARSS